MTRFLWRKGFFSLLLTCLLLGSFVHSLPQQDNPSSLPLPTNTLQFSSILWTYQDPTNSKDTLSSSLSVSIDPSLFHIANSNNNDNNNNKNNTSTSPLCLFGYAQLNTLNFLSAVSSAWKAVGPRGLVRIQSWNHHDYSPDCLGLLLGNQDGVGSIGVVANCRTPMSVLCQAHGLELNSPSPSPSSLSSNPSSTPSLNENFDHTEALSHSDQATSSNHITGTSSVTYENLEQPLEEPLEESAIKIESIVRMSPFPPPPPSTQNVEMAMNSLSPNQMHAIHLPFLSLPLSPTVLPEQSEGRIHDVNVLDHPVVLEVGILQAPIPPSILSIVPSVIAPPASSPPPLFAIPGHVIQREEFFGSPPSAPISPFNLGILPLPILTPALFQQARKSLSRGDGLVLTPSPLESSGSLLKRCAIRAGVSLTFEDGIYSCLLFFFSLMPYISFFTDRLHPPNLKFFFLFSQRLDRIPF